MPIEIRRLDRSLLDDWLHYFDHTACSGGNPWAGCYCMHYHWYQAYEDAFKVTGQADGRAYAIEHIREGIMQGYLAYRDGQPVGWCNANDKQNYDTVLSKIHWEDSERGKKIKAIVCFHIAPDFRNQGIATALLSAVCEDAAREGYDYVEAYPFLGGANLDYHGSISMYRRQGFEACDERDGYSVVRKHLCKPENTK